MDRRLRRRPGGAFPGHAKSMRNDEQCQTARRCHAATEAAAAAAALGQEAGDRVDESQEAGNATAREEVAASRGEAGPGLTRRWSAPIRLPSIRPCPTWSRAACLRAGASAAGARTPRPG